MTKASETSNQVVIEFDGTKYVMLGKLCKAAGIPYNRGLEVARLNAQKVGREARHIDVGNTKATCILLPLSRLGIWLKLLDPSSIGNSAVAKQIAHYQKKSSKPGRAPYPPRIAMLLEPASGRRIVEETVESITAPAEFCDAVSSPHREPQGPLVSIASKIQKCEHRLRISERAAAASRKELADLKKEMAKALGLNAEPEFSTVADYCARNRINLDTKMASALGRVASRYCQDRNIETGLAPHPFYKTVRTYPVEAIEFALSVQGGTA